MDSYKAALLISVNRKTIQTNINLKGKLYEQMPGHGLFQMSHADSLQENQISLLSVSLLPWPQSDGLSLHEQPWQNRIELNRDEASCHYINEETERRRICCNLKAVD